MLMKRFAELLLPLKSQYLMNIELTNCQLMKPRMPQALMKKNPMKKKLLTSQLKILVEAQTLELFMLTEDQDPQGEQISCCAIKSA